MNEKIEALAELFARRAEVDREILAAIGESDDEQLEQEDEATEELPKKSKKRKAGKWTKHNPMPEEVKEAIRAGISAGSSGARLASEHGVSIATIYKIGKSLPDSVTTKNNEVRSYICIDGHEFNSKLPLLDVICPICHSIDCEVGTLNGEVQEGEE